MYTCYYIQRREICFYFLFAFNCVCRPPPPPSKVSAPPVKPPVLPAKQLSQPGAADVNDVSTRLALCKAEMQEAISSQHFEKCAGLRDQIMLLEKEVMIPYCCVKSSY